MGLSPGAHTVTYATKCMKRLLDKLQMASLPSSKRRRLVLKQQRSSYQGANEALEGDMYKSGIAHEDSPDTEQIPDTIPKGIFKPVILPGKPTIITFDLDTTGLIEGRVLPQVIQIAAVELQSGSKFATYVTPTVPISLEASQVTGISMTDGTMTVNGQVVQPVSIQVTVERMIHWLEKFQNVVLVAYNGRRFDFPILVSILVNVGAIDTFNDCALIDSLSIFRQLFPKQSLKQVDLVSQLLGETYNAHDAMADLVALGKLLQFVNLPSKDLMTHSFPHWQCQITWLLTVLKPRTYQH